MGGSKRVAWKDIKASPEQYISKKFLLNNQVLENPTRLHDHVIKAYWKHWHTLAQSGHPFTFKTTAAASTNASEPRGNSSSDGDKGRNLGKGENTMEVPTQNKDKYSDLDEGKQSVPDEAEDSGLDPSSSSSSDSSLDSGLDKDEEKGSGPDEAGGFGLGKDSAKDLNLGQSKKSSGIGGKLTVPEECRTDEDKITFLRSLAGASGQPYQTIVSAVAQTSVSFCFGTYLRLWSSLQGYFSLAKAVR